MKLPAAIPPLLVAALALAPCGLPVPAVAGPVETVKLIRGTGVIRSIDRAQMRLTLTHEPIRELGWPAGTVNVAVSPDLPLGTLWPGQQVVITLEETGRIIGVEPVLEADAIPLFPDH
jgi:Cu/Ag efflux protein CusF